MKRITTITHFFLISLMLIEVALQTQDIKHNWFFYALTLCWIIISQVRLYMVKQIKYKQVTLLFDILISGWLIFAYGQVNYSGLALASLSAMYVMAPIPYYVYVIVLYGLNLVGCVYRQEVTGLQLVYWVLGIGLLSLIYFLLKRDRQRQTQYQALQEDLWQEQKAKEVVEASVSTLKDVYVLRERNRISRDLHDSVGHSLSTMIVQLGAIAKLSENAQPEVAQMATTLRDFAATGLKEVRQVIHDLRPDQLDAGQLNLALEDLFQGSQNNGTLTIDFRHNQPSWQLTEQQELVIYRACQEFLSNTQKYAQASQLTVTLVFSEAELVLTLKDNGQGCQNYTPHMGLNNILDRVDKLQGLCEIKTAPNQGFMLRIVIPNKQGVELGD